MAYLKWILLAVCVGYVIWPLLGKRGGRPDKAGKRS